MPHSLLTSNETDNIDNFGEINLLGVVSSLNIDFKRKKIIYFVVTEHGTGTKHRVYSNDIYAPLQVRDVIHGTMCLSDNMLGLSFSKRPLVKFSTDPKTIKIMMIKALKGTGFGKVKANLLYNRLIILIEMDLNGEITSEDVCNYLDESSSKWNDTRNEKNLDIFCGIISNKQSKKLFELWYRQRVMRKLFLIGFKYKDLLGFHKTSLQLYQECSENPFSISEISIEKAISISEILKIDINDEKIKLGKIVRKIRELSLEKGHSCISFGKAQKSIKGIIKHIRPLIKEYKIIFNKSKKSIYLGDVYEIESNLAKKLAEIIKHKTFDKSLGRKTSPPKFSKLSLGSKGALRAPHQSRIHQKINKKVSGKDPIITSSASKFKYYIKTKPMHNFPMIPNFDFGSNSNASISNLDSNDLHEVTSNDLHEIKITDRWGRSPTISIEDLKFTIPSITKEQKKAIHGVFTNDITIITGGAGTGKSTIIKELIYNMERFGKTFYMASFTGKAVSRIKQITKSENASTLNMMMLRDIPSFEYLIIDEASMVTESLFYRFCEMYNWKHKLIFIGDVNQLQPIGNGILFFQLLKVKQIPIFRLTKNLRVSESGRKIIDNAEKIIRYRLKKAELKKSNRGSVKQQFLAPFEFDVGAGFYLHSGSTKEIYKIITKLYENGIDFENTTVITPYNEYLDIINKKCQEIFNSGSQIVIDSQGHKWRLGDKVIMNKNNYDINVFNGEIGRIIDIHEDEDPDESFISVKLEGGGNTFKFKLNIDLDEGFDDLLESERKDFVTVKHLSLAYCLTIHKSQGSEWDHVLVYIPTGKSLYSPTGEIFLDNTLMYTAVTRAKKSCYIVGSIMLAKQAIASDKGERREHLAQMIEENLEK